VEPGRRPTRTWLRGLAFADVASRMTFADYLASVDALVGRRETLELALAEIAPESPWAETIARLRCFRGIDTLAAIGLCAEIGDFARFGKPTQLSGFLGLVPPRTRGGCWWRRPSTAGAARRSPSSCAGARPARTRGSVRSPGAPRGAFTISGRSS